MKNKIKLVLLAFVMCIIAIPSMTAKAAGEEVSQTAAGANTANIQWVSTYNSMVEGYLIFVDNLQEPVAQVPATQNTYQITGLMTGSVHLVAVAGIYQGKPYVLAGTYDRYGNESYTDGMLIKVVTKPNKTVGVNYLTNSYFGYKSSYSSIYVQWNQSGDVDGYEAVLCNKKGKVIERSDVNKLGTVFYKSNCQNVYQIKVRSYLTMTNGQKVYGDYSAPFYAVPQPVSTSTNSDVHLNSVNLKWKKVKGASQYIIYGSTSKNSGYKKIATVKGTKKSYNITKLKGKTINTLDRKYYFKIVAVAKFGKKKVTSKKKGMVSAQTVRVY